ncbi:universal stress protein [Gordonia sp. SID5947]|uniref:universal stress protein n=1 Tax=Gordonia sp. SID5947 TaxID=2690315 RepID=UPI00136DA055|nr:universal stress protein [Gordonia sp. SID5947]MYR06063.1 universal stress protein [Gordonia sp. SID5947]
MRLLVAYLATTGGADAISVGVRLARTLDAELDVCMVVPRDRTAPLLPTANYDEVLIEQSEQWLADAVEMVPADVKVTTHVVLHDSAGQGLLDETDRLGADALVVGGSGGGLARSHSLGSVVDELLHASSVPVVLAPRGARHCTAERIREITCAIGTLPGSDELLDAAVRISAEGELPLRLVSLVGLDDSDDPQRPRLATTHAQETLDKAVAALPPATSVTACVAEGASVEGAVDSLDWHDGDLMLVGSSRMAQPRRLFLGSTAAKMLRVLAVPMVVVPRGDG